jgi:uncharacterized SAM-binding protein YcdF (DUF218 family)
VTRRRRRRVAAATFAAACIVFAIATARLFVWPHTAVPERADAVVVLGGRSEPERLPRGLALMQDRVAPALVITAPPETSLCRGDGRFDVICVNPQPFSTRGEARAVARIAAARAWSSLVVVTSTYHVTRAKLLLGRCYGGAISAGGATPQSRTEWARRTLHEWGGVVYALTLERDC